MAVGFLQRAAGGERVPAGHADNAPGIRIIGVGIAGAAAWAVLPPEVMADFMCQDCGSAAEVVPSHCSRVADIPEAGDSARVADFHHAVVVAVGHSIGGALGMKFAQNRVPSSAAARKRAGAGIKGRAQSHIYRVRNRMQALGKVHPICQRMACPRHGSGPSVGGVHGNECDPPCRQRAHIQG